MAMRAISMDAIKRYVSVSDPSKHTDEKAKAGEPNREATDATVFLLGPIPARVQTMINDVATSSKQDDEDAMVFEFHPNEASYLRCQFGLRGFERFLDQGGNEVAFKTTNRQLGGQAHVVAAPEIMDMLGMDLIRELASEIEKFNELNQADRKN